MHFKMIIAVVDDSLSERLLEAARKAGATGATVLNQARGEGLKRATTFFGLSLESPRDVILFLVEEHMSRRILDRINQVGAFEERPGLGIAVQLDVEDAVGIASQARMLRTSVEEEI